MGALGVADTTGNRLLQFARVRMTKKLELERRRREKEREEEEEQARVQQTQSLLSQLSTPVAAYQFVNACALAPLHVTPISTAQGALAMVSSRNLFDTDGAFSADARAIAQYPADNLSHIAFGQSISLYPRITGHDAGRPSSDAYGALIYTNCIVAAVADGLDWGHAAQRAGMRTPNNNERVSDFEC
jgi:hypothetical protein